MKSKLLIFFFSIGWPLSAQTLIGTVCDQERNLLPYVSVMANRVGSGAVEAFTQTDRQGKYQFKLKTYGLWELTFSSLSYNKTTIRVNVDKDTISVTDVAMQSTPIALQEVEIRPNVPIFLKKDTVVFNVASFLRGNERVVEDVLKNLPGIEVDKQGTIRANGKEVEKVLLENDDLLNKGYALLTKGLPVKAITQVELIQGYTENRLIKGIGQSDKVALNLKLDEKVKHRWIGSLNATYGVEDVYAGHASVLGVGKQDKHYMTADMNNAGYAATSSISNILDISGIDFSASKNVTIGLTLPEMDLNRCNFNQERMISDNSIFRFGKKWKVQLSAAANADKRKADYQMLREYNIDSAIFSHITKNQAEEKPRNYIGKIAVSGDVSDNSTLENTTQYRRSSLKTNSLTQLNDLSFNENLKTTDDFFSQKIVYTNRLSEDKLLRINAHYVYSRIPQHYVIDSLEGVQPRQFWQYSVNKKQQYGLAISYLHRFNKQHKIEAHAGTHTNADEMYSSDNPADAGDHNKMQIKTWDYYAGLRYAFSYKNMTFIGGSTLKTYQISGGYGNTYFRLEPFFMWEWKPGKAHKFDLTWIHKYDYPSLADVYPYSVRNSLNVSSSGADAAKLLSDWILAFDYQYGNWSDVILGNVNLLFLKSEKYYSSEFFITPENMYVKKIPLKNKEVLSLSGNINYYVSPLSSNIRLSGGLNYMRYNYLMSNTEEFQVYKSIGYTCGLAVRSAFLGAFNFDMGGLYTRNQLKDENTHIAKSSMYANLILSGKKWNMEVHSEYFYWGGTNSNSSNYYFIDAKGYYILVPNKWTISIKGENLLNVRTYMEESLDEISQNKYESRLLPRRVLLSVEYKF